ncbi:MAG: hypothetical protein P8Y95_09090, partial [Gammaproteobacteria bacterium]
GALGLTFGNLQEQEKKVENYRRIIQSCDPVGSFVNEQVATVNFLYCHQDEEQGINTGQRLATTFGYMAAQLVSAREAYPSRSYASFGLLPQARRQATSPGERPGVPEGLCIGNPDRIIRALKGWESTGTTAVNFLLNALETVPQEEVLASLQLFADEVMPHFKEDTHADLRHAGS